MNIIGIISFGGGMAIAIPFIGVGAATSSATVLHRALICGTFLVLEVVTIIAACSAFQKYVDSASNIMEGFDYAQRMGETTDRRLGTPGSASTGAETRTTPSSASASAAKTAVAAPEKMIKPETEDSCAVTEASTPEAAIGSAKSQKD